MTPISFAPKDIDFDLSTGDLRYVVSWDAGVRVDQKSMWVEEGEIVAKIVLIKEEKTQKRFETVEVTAPAEGFLVPLAGLGGPSLLRVGDPIALISDSLEFGGGVEYEVVMPEDTWLGKVTPLEEHAKFSSTLEEGLVDLEDGISDVIWGRLERNGRVIEDLRRNSTFEAEAVYYLAEDGKRIRYEEGRRCAVFLEVLTGEMRSRSQRPTSTRRALKGPTSKTQTNDKDTGREPERKREEDTHGGKKKSSRGTEKRGYVYVLSHPEMPNVVKVGSTERTPEERVEELSSATGVPGPFQVVFKKAVQQPMKREIQAHRRLSKHRVSPRREFFEVSKEKAVDAIEEETQP